MFDKKTITCFIICISNKMVFQEISKNYVLRVTPLPKSNEYILREIVRSYSVGEDNFQSSVQATLKYLNNKKFLEYLEANQICHIVFYENNQQNNNGNIINSMSKQNDLSTIAHLFIRVENKDNTLTIYTYPNEQYKNKILDKKSEIISFYEKQKIKIETIRVKYELNNVVLDSMSEELIRIGFTPFNNKK